MNGLTWAQLAAELGHARSNLSEWRKLPGAPAGRDPVEWREFIDANKLGEQVEFGMHELKQEKLRKEIRLKDLQIAEKERKSVPIEEVDALLLKVGTKQKAHMYAVFGSSLPIEIAGQDAGTCRAKLLKVADEMCAAMQLSVEKWRTDTVTHGA